MAETVAFNRIPGEAKERWQVVRDVCAGDQALRQGAYLPYLNRQDIGQSNLDRNAAYVRRAVLYAATSFTRDGLVGLAFRLDPRNELPTKLEYLLVDADGAGTSIYQQSQAVLASNLEIGRHGLYVDFSEALARPVIKSYSAEDIINWRYALIGGKRELTLVILRETIEVENGYGFTAVVQFRELALEDGVCVTRLWLEGANQDAPVVKMMVDANGDEVDQLVLRSAGETFNFIPFQFVGSQANNADIDTSPLYGLAQVNIAHFRNSADYEDSVFFVGQVQPYISGLDTEWRDHLQNPIDPATGQPTGQKIYVGSRAPIPLPAGGTFGFAQAQPNTLVGEAMKHKEEQMIALGARMIEATRAGKTATGENNDREATTSVLAMCVSNVSEAYQAVIGWCARYLDMGEYDAANAYKINQDFVQQTADPAIMAQLVASWQTGVISKVDLRALYRKLGIIAVERTDDEIQTDLDNEGPALGTVGLDGEPLPPGGKPPIGTGGIKGVPPNEPQNPPIDPVANPPVPTPPLPVPALGLPPPAPAPITPITPITPIENRLEQSDLDSRFAELLLALRTPSPPANITVNVPAPVVNINQAPVTIAGDTVNVAPPAVTVEGTTVNVAPPSVNVESPTVNVAAPVVNLPAPEPRNSKAKFTTDENGDITGASLNP